MSPLPPPLLPLTISVEEVREARERIAPYIRQTPLIPFDHLAGPDGKSVLLKCEALQRTGSFKMRGAANCILQNIAQAKKCGVIAASAGNHAQGVAAVCHLLGIRATIVMPTVTPPLKVQNTLNWGANVELVGSVYDESFEFANKLAQAKGYLFIHPFRDHHILVGQGTLALELLEHPSFQDVEAVLFPIGGGGLISGCAQVFRQLRPKLKIYGLTARNAPATWKSFQKKQVVQDVVHPTLADGIANKKPDLNMLELLMTNVDEIFSLGEEPIACAISLLAERAKLVVEGSGAITVAAVLENLVPEKKVCAVLSGGNIDTVALSHVLQRGLVEQGRLVRLVISIPDRPGGLLSVTQVLAEKGANILQVFHQRATLKTSLGETEIEVDMETRGREFTEEIIHTLTEKGFRVQRVT
jgi:threonine dehydratase